jgi:hypothetical protein
MALPHKSKSEQPAAETPQNIPKIGSVFKWVTCNQEMRYMGQIKQSSGIMLNFTYTVSRTKQGEILTLTPYQLDEALRLGRLIKIQ